MSLETRLPEAMRAAVADLQPPPTLAERGMARGVRMRRRRRAEMVAGVAALAAIAVGGAVVPGAVGSTARQATTARATVRSTPSPLPTFSSEQVIAILRGLLPTSGQVTVNAPRPNMYPLSATGSYDDGKGVSGFNFEVSGDQGITYCVPRELRPWGKCFVSRLPGGSVVVVDQGFTWPNEPGREKDWSARLVRPNGAFVQIDAYNSAEEKSPAGPTRTNPALGVAQLQAIVSSPRWTPVLDSLAATTPHSVLPPSQVMPGAQVLATLKKLLPAGMRTNSDYAQDGYGLLVTDDGKGEAMLGVDIQAQMKSVIAIDCKQRVSEEQAGTCTRTVLPGGAVLYLTSGPGSKGGEGIVEYVADLIYPDGTRVSAQEANSYSEGAPKTRPLPPLSLDQLSTLVRNPIWRR
jgi:hypothetical protein